MRILILYLCFNMPYKYLIDIIYNNIISTMYIQTLQTIRQLHLKNLHSL